jgi:hypothetical protein
MREREREREPLERAVREPSGMSQKTKKNTREREIQRAVREGR